MFKKLSAVACSCITVLLLLLSLIGGAVHTAAATLDEMTSTAISCIMSHEGSYGSVNRNDCGAVSIGKLQWHAGRALGLLQSICYSAPDLSQSTLGSTLYNEILSSSNWNYRTFTVSEGSAVATLLTTDAGIAAQDALAYSDVQGYIVSGQNKGLVSEGALVMYADIYNFGSGIASRIASRAAGYAGSYGAVSLDDMYRAAMNDSYNSDAAFVQRTNMVYQSLLSMNIGDGDTETTAPVTDPTDEPTQETTTVVTSDFSDSYAGTYVVTASALNLRSNPSTSASVVATLPRNAVVTVTMANGSWAAVTYEGKNGYCSMDYLTVMPDVTTEEMTTISEEITTTEETTTTTEAITMEETTTVETDAEVTETETSATEETVVTTTTAAAIDDNKNHGVAATLYGDVDGDGEVTAIDAVLLQKHINGMVFLSHEQMANADCVADGVLDEADVAVILQHLIGHYTALPIY